MVLRNRKTFRNRNRNCNRQRNHKRKTFRKRKTIHNRHKTRGGNTTDPLYTTNDTIDGVPITPGTTTFIPGLGSIPVNQLKEYMESRAYEAY